MLPRTTFLMPALGLVLALPALGLAQKAEEDSPRRSTSYSRAINIPALMDAHVRMLTRRYNLSDEQEEFTHAYLRDRTDAFLEVYGEDLFELVDTLMAVRTGGAELSQAELVAWGERALPLYEAAKSVIIEGNDEWRGILNEEQKQVHDRDLEEMFDSFDITEQHLGRIVAGEITLEEFINGTQQEAQRRARERAARHRQADMAEPAPQPQPAPDRARPAPSQRPAEPKAGRTTPQRPEPQRDTAKPQPARPAKRGSGGGDAFESQWETYVKQFIERYALDDAQKQRAETILESCQAQATRLMKKRKPALANLDEQVKKLTEVKDKDERKTKELNDLMARRAKMLEFVDEIFEKQLKPRLEKLPTRDQREAAEKRPSRPAPRRTPPKRSGDDDDEKSDD
jgi:hypothetical protein